MGNMKSFIHGNAIVAEHTGNDVFINVDGINNTDAFGLPQVWGKRYQGRSGIGHWFHSPIPTPVGPESPVQLEDVFIFFKTLGSCQMEELMVYDGPDFIRRFKLGPPESAPVSGDFSHAPTFGKNAFNVREESGPKKGSTHTMKYGLNMGIKINFIGDSEVQFFSAGASFITSD